MNDDEQRQESEPAEDAAPGWQAIDAELATIYGAAEPFHYGTLVSYRLGGPDPLDGVSVYARQEPVPHWHYVTYGLTELYEKESQNAEYSGFGFELTFRLARQGEEEPPAWAINFLQNLARYVFSSGNVFEPGHHLDANGPIKVGEHTKLTAVAFVEDPELGTARSPFGKFTFIQAVGITEDEMEIMQAWNTLRVMETVKSRLPLYITDLSRNSLFDDPGVLAAAEEGSRAEGSNTGHLYFDNLLWEEKRHLLKSNGYILQMGAKQTLSLARILPARLAHGKELALIGQERRVLLIPDLQNRLVENGDELQIYLNTEAVTELARRLEPRAGEFELETLKALKIRIEKTLIRDADGNVVETIG
ncbi:suppressor of fused domain protein [Saccharibacillus sp. CPCC 101409]|uniref:suppressor of fused domain protein n=1 Tax=Saccharibacillus sp. CPCC 101409 TaxID=3058041 RepID=UPI00267265B1|nr:suppressor of fused domain protein [Saccharibacillus sp. CPCC 101409]MDO3409399.1 suppressor of fused domain protein [Saccharibacillus sp. CPCC 101409]